MIIAGDCLNELAKISSKTIQTCITSPPYFNLRNYDHPDQIGTETNIKDYIANLVKVFRLVRDALKDDGTLWINIGDTYSNKTVKDTSIKAKDLMGIPWMLAFALRDDGWVLRQDIIWSKPNPMPESIIDRCTKAHEYIFLLAKQHDYYYDRMAIAEPAIYAAEHGAKATSWGKKKLNINKNNIEKYQLTGIENNKTCLAGGKRNKRSVWTVQVQPYKDAHFACVDQETECLTTSGWKKHGDIRPGMLAAQFDMTTQRLSWAPIEDIASYEVNDQLMIIGKARDLDMWLTPNHRSVILRRHSQSRQLLPPVIVRADELKASHSILTGAAWDFVGDTSTALEWAELLGWYVAEGHESKDSLAVELYQSETANPEKCRRIEDLLRQTGTEWSKATAVRQWRGQPTVAVAYRIIGYAAVRLREMAPGKRLPWAVILWSDDRIVALLNGLIEGDGHTRLDGRRCFVQKDSEQCGLVQALAMRLGLSAIVSGRPANMNVVYLTKHQTRSFRGTNGLGTMPELRQYTGTVWCPKLPAGTWVARRNGRPFITGNTFPEQLIEPCVLASTREDDIVLDPFSGAGTTGVVAKRHRRNYVGIELNPDYVALSEDRIAKAPLGYSAQDDSFLVPAFTTLLDDCCD